MNLNLAPTKSQGFFFFIAFLKNPASARIKPDRFLFLFYPESHVWGMSKKKIDEIYI